MQADLQKARKHMQDDRNHAEACPLTSHKYDESDKEYALIRCAELSISGEDFHYPNIGRRANVFDGPATALYIPEKPKFKVTGDTEVRSWLQISGARILPVL